MMPKNYLNNEYLCESLKKTFFYLLCSSMQFIIAGITSNLLLKCPRLLPVSTSQKGLKDNT